MRSDTVEKLPRMRPHDALPLVTESHVRLLELLESLQPDDWDTITACDPWTVKDIVAHLLGTTKGMASPREYLRQGMVARSLMSEIPNLFDALNHAQVEEGESKTPSELVDELRRAMPKARRNHRLLNAGFGPLPLYIPFFGGLINIRYVLNTIYLRDLLIHRLDIAFATASDPLIGPADETVMLDMIKEWTEKSGAKIKLDLKGTIGAHYMAGDDAPLATISVEPEKFIWSLAGRGDKTDLSVEGDAPSVERWLRVRPSI